MCFLLTEKVVFKFDTKSHSIVSCVIVDNVEKGRAGFH